MTDANDFTRIDGPQQRDQASRRFPETMQPWDERLLPLGTHVSEFEINGVLGEGGFGIVYLARDHSLDRDVAVKEYMPATLAARRNRTQVNPVSERYRDDFDIGLNSFINEAKLLAHFDNPALVKVHRFWQEHGTAYMVMPYYKGVTLGKTVRELSAPPSQAWLCTLLSPLMDALAHLHAAQCYHRDVAPDNVLILEETGLPLLLDFGAARRVLAGQAHALTTILKPGYAPIEQYGEIPGMQQGPWTDVYALASVVYWAITGKTPPPATVRHVRDAYVPLADCAPPHYRRQFVTAIDRALVVLPEGRTESIDRFRSELGLLPSNSTIGSPTHRWADSEATRLGAAGTTPPDQAPAANRRTHATPTSGAPAGLDPRAATAPAMSRKTVMVAAGVMVLMIGAVVAVSMQGRTPVSAPSVAADPVRTTPASPSPAMTPPIPAASTVTSRSNIERPESAAGMLALLRAKQDPSITVQAAVGKSTSPSANLPLTIRFTASQPGQVYLIGMHDGDNELIVAYPRQKAIQKNMESTGNVILPPGLLASGTWSFLVVSSRQPVDLTSHGWSYENNLWRLRFPLTPGPGSLQQMPWDFSNCAPERADCSFAFGAAPLAATVASNPKPSAERSPSAKAPAPVQAVKREVPLKRLKSESQVPTAVATRPNPECERILIRLSLGESSAALMDQLKQYQCK